MEFIAPSLSQLILDLQEFYKDKFVIATQVWSDLQTKSGKWTAIVYYKIPPEKQEQEEQGK